MVDYFALLGEKRRPYLDAERVAETFRELSRSQHPDQREDGAAGEANADFARLNQAQQTLRDPKSRLGYLLGLEFPELRLTGPAEVPPELADLFAPVHGLLADVAAFQARQAAAGSALARALLAREALAWRERVEAQLEALNGLYAQALAELQAYDATWRAGDPDGQRALLGFYQRFAYLSRWLEQLGERLFALGT